MNAPQSNKSPIEEFLTPEAMLTPGVAGALTMMITNALTVNFEMPRAWIGLGLSFVFGLLVLVATRNVLVKGVFYVLNSLVIFCVAVGANGIGTGPGASPRASVSLTTAAIAQDASPASKEKQALEYCSNLSAVVAEAQKNNQPPEKILELIKPCQNASNEILKGGSLGAPTSIDKSTRRRFFSPWDF